MYEEKRTPVGSRPSALFITVPPIEGYSNFLLLNCESSQEVTRHRLRRQIEDLLAPGRLDVKAESVKRRKSGSFKLKVRSLVLS